MRHQAHHFLGRPRQHGDHQDGERDAARERREPVGRPDDERPGDDAAHDMATEGAAVHSALLPTAAPRATRQMRMRAIAFTTTVTTKSPSPTSNSAARYMVVVASLNSLAIAAAMV